MAIRIVRLGSDRVRDEGPRLGTVRRPRCHRSVLGQLLAEHGAELAPDDAPTKEG